MREGENGWEIIGSPRVTPEAIEEMSALLDQRCAELLEGASPTERLTAMWFRQQGLLQGVKLNFLYRKRVPSDEEISKAFVSWLRAYLS